MNIIFRCIHGSHLYGTNTPESDMDYKGVYLPTLDQLLLGNAPKCISTTTGKAHSKNTKEDIDDSMYSLPYFIYLCCQGETVALDMLHADTYPDMILETSEVWRDLVAHKELFYTKNMKAFLGYCRKQAHKYGVKGSRMGALEALVEAIKGGDSHKWMIDRQVPVKLGDRRDQLPINDYCFFSKSPMNEQGKETEFYHVLGAKYQLSITMEEFKGLMDKKWLQYGERSRLAKENKGIDWKAISHALRAAYQLRGIYEDGGFNYPLDQAWILNEVKAGNWDFVESVSPHLDNMIKEVEELAENSSYPDKVDVEFWDEWLLETYRWEYM